MFFMNSNLSISEQKTVLNFYRYTPHIQNVEIGVNNDWFQIRSQTLTLPYTLE